MGYFLYATTFFTSGGWVPGYVTDHEGGSCAMEEVGEERYNQVKNNMETYNPALYHLSKFNCRDWAANVLAGQG